MKKWDRLAMVFILSALLCLVASGAAFSEGTIIDLGALPVEWSWASGIKDSSQIVRYSATASGLQEPTGQAADSGISKYAFIFYYTDGSGDNYKGNVYAPTGMLFSGQKLEYQPEEMGGGKIEGGYYYIDTSLGGYDSSYDRKETIISYTDGDTGFTSNFFGNHPEGNPSGGMTIDNRSTTAEEGSVYDPSIGQNDAYWGNGAVLYEFSTKSNSVNFLAAYINDLPYWTQPSEYPGSCAEVAGAIVIDYWYNTLGYDTMYGPLWDDNTTSDDYTSFIGTLANYMGYDGSTSITEVGPGLKDFTTDNSLGKYLEYNWDYFYSNSELKSKLLDGQPVILALKGDASGSNYDDLSHDVVARGYWNDGQILCNWGWGSNNYETEDSSRLSNVVINLDSSKHVQIYAKNITTGEVRSWDDVYISSVVYLWPE